MFEVVYYARCGNEKSICQSTKGLADVIAAELGVRAEDIAAEPKLSGDAFAFVGCSCYGSKSGGRLSAFIAENDFGERPVALFGTSLSGKNDGVARVEEMLRSAGALVRGSFFCERKALPFLHRGRPSREELAGARKFANEMKP